MPKLKRSGNVFRLGADGAFDGIWYSSGKVQASAGITYEGGVEFCHGLEADVGIAACAEIEGALTVFLPSVRAEGRAFAALGAGVQAQLAPNIFDKAGLSVDAMAFAQASVAGRIALALDFEEIAEIARQELSGLAYDLFLAFLNEIVVEAGVWGRASFSAMAELHLDINGTVLGDDPGFQVGVGGGAGWGGGTAWDFYAKIGFEDPRRLYTTVSELLIAELAFTARRRLDRRYAPAIEVFEFVAPIAALTAYDLGEIASEEILRPANQSVAPFLKVFSQRLALYVLDKLVEVGAELVSGALMDALSHVFGQPLDVAARGQLQGHIEAAIDVLEDGPLDLDSAVEVLGPVTEALTILAPDTVETWNEDIALLWSAAVTGRALRRSAARAGITLDVLGLGASVQGDLLTIPPAPAVVHNVYERHLGSAPTVLGFDDVIDFLAAQSIAPLLELHAPTVDVILGEVAHRLGITLGDLVAAALTGAVGADLSTTDLYLRLRDYCKSAIDTVVLEHLIPPMRTALEETPDAVLYLDDVVVPVLTATSEFTFDRVDRMAQGIGPAEFDLLNPSFKAGLADLVWLMFARNVVFFADLLLDHALDALRAGFIDLEAQVRGGAGDAMVEGSLTLAEEAFPALSPSVPAHADALRNLVADLLDAGSAAFGPQIWTLSRRAELKALTRRLLDRGAAGDYGALPSADSVLDQLVDESFVAELAECYFVADAAGLIALLQALSELTAEEFEVVTGRALPALERFFLRISLPALAQVEATVAAHIAALADELQDILDRLAELRGAIDDLAQEIAELGGDAAAALTTIATDLASAQWRNGVLDGLLARGLDLAEQTVRNLPGFDLLPPSKQEFDIGVAKSAFTNSFNALRPVLDTALQLGSPALVGAAAAVEMATDLPLAVSGMTDAITAAFMDAIDAQFTTAFPGVDDPLPSELTIADLEAAILAALSTAALQAQIEAYAEARRLQLEAEAERERLRGEETDLEVEETAARSAQGASVGATPQIRIVSPAPLDAHLGFVYPRTVPVHVEIGGARPAYLVPGAPARTLVRVNGQETDPSASVWRFDEARDLLVLTGEIEAGLRPGLNTLEVSVADGVSEPVRAAVSFLANPEIAPRGRALRVAADLSQFNAPGNDHLNAEEEYVALRNEGEEVLHLEGVRVADRAGHVYIFGPLLLAPSATVRVRTGKGTDTAQDVYWNRSAAVWNNRGDSIYVYDADRVFWTGSAS